MHKQRLRKADGRPLILYSCAPLPDASVPPSPGGAAEPPNAHLRWHPLRAEWVAYATHRQNRTFLPPPEFNPLAPTTDLSQPTEVPDTPWDAAVFENRFPTLTMSAHDPPEIFVPTRPGLGVCEVVVFSRDPAGSLAALPLRHVELLIDVWADRTEELGARPEVEYVFPFENRGVEVGVTLHHPHGQIYAYPFVPPIAARELEQQASHFGLHGRGLLEEFVDREISEARRLIYAGDDAAAFMPVCARYAYEIWIAPRRAVPSFPELTRDERRDFARALKTTLMKFDRLWNTPFPYVLVFHQAPTDGQPHPEAHLHAEIYPAYRMQGRLKYLAGSELGAGVFTSDTVPEEKVKELQAIDVIVDD